MQINNSVDLIEIKTLITSKKYNDIITLLYKEFSKIFKQIAQQDGMTITESNTIINYIGYIKNNSNKYFGHVCLVRDHLFNDDNEFPIEERISTLLEELKFFRKI